MQREARQRASLAKIVRYYRTHLAIRAKREVELTLDRHDAWDEAILHRPVQCAGARDDARATGRMCGKRAVMESQTAIRPAGMSPARRMEERCET